MRGTIRSRIIGGLLAAALAWPAGAAPTVEEQIASLRKRIAAASERDRIAPLNELANLYCRREPARALDLAQEALTLAAKYGDRRGEAGAQRNLGLALMVSEKNAEGLAHMRAAHDLFVEVGDRADAARASGYAGMMLGHLGRVWQAVSAVQQAMAAFRDLGDTKGMAAAANNLGVLYEQVGDHQQALQYNLEALRLEEQLGRKIGIANNLNSVGNIYSRLGEQLKARDYYQRALAIYRELDEPDGIGKCLNNLGNTYEKLGQDDEAMDYFEQSLAMAKRLGSRSNQADPLNNMGIVFKKHGQYEKARGQYFAEMKIREDLGQRQELATDYHNIAETYVLEKKYAEALPYLDKAVGLGKEIRSNEILQAAYLLLGQAYAERKEYQKAYDYQVLYSDTRAAMLDEQRNAKIAELQEKYDADAREREIESLNKDKELLTKDAKIRQLQLGRTRLVAALLVALVVLVLGGAALLFRRYLYLLTFWKKKTFIGQYRVEGELTRGGMGIVYRASSILAPSIPIALKVIREEVAGDDTQRRRFINEGKIIDGLDHPNIVKVIDRGEHNRRLYIAMEYLDGKTVAEIVHEAEVQGHPLPLPRCLDVMRQLTDAVVAIHGKGIVHRDITPANVIVADDHGTAKVKLLDFGIAKADTMSTLTEVGELLGTINYMAPERLQMRELSPASDVFSLGVLFYELLTLRKPFLADEPAEVLRQLLGREPVEPRLFRPEIDDDLELLVMAMLRKEPRRRPEGVEVLHRLDTMLAEAV